MIVYSAVTALGALAIASTISGGKPKRTFSGITSTSCTLSKPSVLKNFTTSSTRHSGAEAPGQSNRLHTFQPVWPDILEAVNEMPPNTQVASHFHQPIRIRTIIGTDHQQQICVRGYVLYRDLPVLGGIANILRCRPLDIGEPLPQRRNNVLVSSRLAWSASNKPPAQDLAPLATPLVPGTPPPESPPEPRPAFQSPHRDHDGRSVSANTLPRANFTAST